MGISPQRLRLQWQGEPPRMSREYLKRYSQELQRDMEILSFGHAGLPVIVFPTSMGRFHDYEDQGMIAALAPKIDAGELPVFCADSVDGESWYNKSVPPRQRVLRHLQYERYLLHELLPLIRSKNASPQLALTGCSFGGYHTMNFALKHPDLVSYCVSMGGAFDIHQFLDGYYDSDCYFNCPPDFLANLTDEWYLSRYRRLNIVLATGEQDICKDENLRLSGILHARAVPHFLDVWGNNTGHDWPWWRQMAVKFFL